MRKKILVIGVLSVCLFSLTGCESWNRIKKNFGSSVEGLNRTVEVYTLDGKLLKEYKGKLDIAESESGNKVKFDLNGKRIIINNAIVISEED